MQKAAAPATAGEQWHLPLGFRFKPSDHELVNHFLRPRLLHKIPAPQYLIQERDVYKFEPWDLAEEYEHSFVYGNVELNEMYFFTPRHPAGNYLLSKSKRASRTTKRGLWDGRSGDMLIKNQHREVIGHKVELNFAVFDGGKKLKTPWLMHEYRIHSSSDDNAFDDLVLCRIFKKKTSRGDDDACEEVHEVEEPAATGQELSVVPLLGDVSMAPASL